MQRREFALAVLALTGPLASHAQADYPNKPVQIVVPFTAGQSGDVLARLLSEPLGRSLGKSFIVDNKPGAGGTLGSSYVARATPDGYTLLLGSSGPMSIAPNLYKNAGYDPRKDFTPIMTVAGVSQALVVPANSRYRTLAELITAAKANPGKFSYASGGNGSTQHLTMEMLNQAAGIDMLHIPYKGTPSAYTDLLGGSLDAFFDSEPGVVPFLKSGQIRVLAVSTAKRSSAMPNVPTVAESGYPGFEVMGWLGIVGPKGMNPAVREKLNAELKKAVASDAVKANLAKFGMIPIADSPEEFARFIEKEMAKFGAVIKAGNITVE